jgi:hypothetical protein
MEKRRGDYGFIRDANKYANARFAFYLDAFYTYFILKSRV